jgi:superfamily II DNA or RNA helicase
MVVAYSEFGTIDEQAEDSPRYAPLAKLHAYQSTALQLSMEQWYQEVRRQMVVLPTGTGKTVLFATLPLFYRFNGRILVLVHRDTLAEQAKKTIQEWNPYAGKVGIEMGTKYKAQRERIVVASVQTIGRFSSTENEDGTINFKISKRLAKFNPDEFDAIIVDECHHSAASGYLNIFRHFGFLDDRFRKVSHPPKRLLFGVTATPRRLDKKRLSDVYDRKVFDYPIEDAIREGWLVNPRCFRVKTSISLDGVSLSEEDLEELSKIVNTPARNKLIVREWLDKAADRKTICFAVDVKHAVDLAREFRNAGVAATAVWGDDKDKDQKLKLFKQGKYKVLLNCEILVEGYDDRSIACVIMARPTDSESMFKQMVGRAMRLEDGVLNILLWDALKKPVTKRNCLVLEISDARAKKLEHNLAMSFAQAYELPDDFDLEGQGLLEAKDVINRLKPRAAKDKETEKALADAKSMEELTELVSHELHATVEEIDLLKVTFDSMVLTNSQLQWHRTSKENYVLMLPERMGYIRLWRNEDGVIVIDGHKLKAPHTFYLTGSRRREDFGRGFAAADQQVMKRFGKRVFDMCERNSTSANWKTLPASPAQLTRLTKLYEGRGMHMPTGITSGEASLLITKMMAQAAAA